jgi:hypothetical protein
MPGGTVPELDEALVIANLIANIPTAPSGMRSVTITDPWISTFSGQGVRDLWANTIAAPANWVGVPQTGFSPSPAEVTGGAFSSGLAGGEPFPVLDIENPPEIEVTATRIPLSDLTNEELEEIGTDSAYYELGLRRGYAEPDSAFNSPGYYPPSTTYPRGYTTRPDPFRNYGPPTPPPPPPKPAPVAEALPIFGRILLGLGALFFPQPMGPRRLDEAPYIGDFPWELERKPVPREKPAPIPVWFDDPWPIEVPFYERIPERIPVPDRERRVLPIGDYPGMLADPFGLPELPFPAPFTDPDTRPGDRPDRFTPLPFPDSFPRVDAPPRGAPFDIPDVFDAPPGYPPRFEPPRITLPVSPGTDLFNIPLPQFQAQPLDFGLPVDTAQADRCNCPSSDKKKKKKTERKKRTVCYRGTYREYADGTSKKKLEQVPCDTKGKLDRVRKVGSTLAPLFNPF